MATSACTAGYPLGNVMPISLVVGVISGEVKWASPSAEICWGLALKELRTRAPAPATCVSTNGNSIHCALAERRSLFGALLAPELAEMLFADLEAQLANGASSPDVWGLTIFPSFRNLLPHTIPSVDSPDSHTKEPEQAPADATPCLSVEHIRLHTVLSNSDLQQRPLQLLRQEHQCQQQMVQMAQHTFGQQEAHSSQIQLYSQTQQEQQPRREALQVAPNMDPVPLPLALADNQTENNGDYILSSSPDRTFHHPSTQRPRALRAPREPIPAIYAPSAVVSDGSSINREQPYYMSDIVQLRTYSYMLGDARAPPSRTMTLRAEASNGSSSGGGLLDANVRRLLLDSAESIHRLGADQLAVRGSGPEEGDTRSGGGGITRLHRGNHITHVDLDADESSDMAQRAILDNSALVQGSEGGSGAAAAAAAPAGLPARGGFTAAAGLLASASAASVPTSTTASTAFRPYDRPLAPARLPAPPSRVETIEEVDESQLLVRLLGNALPIQSQLSLTEWQGLQRHEDLGHTTGSAAVAKAVSEGETVGEDAAAVLYTTSTTSASVTADYSAGMAVSARTRGGTADDAEAAGPCTVDPEKSPFTYTTVAVSQQEQMEQERRREVYASSGPWYVSNHASPIQQVVRRMSTRSRLDTLLRSYNPAIVKPMQQSNQGSHQRRGGGGGSGSGGRGRGGGRAGGPSQTDSGPSLRSHVVAGTASRPLQQPEAADGSHSSGHEAGCPQGLHSPAGPVIRDDYGSSDRSQGMAMMDEDYEDEDDGDSEDGDGETDGEDVEESGTRKGDQNWSHGIEGRWHQVRLQLLMPSAVEVLGTTAMGDNSEAVSVQNAEAAGPSSSSSTAPAAVPEPLLQMVLTEVDELVRKARAVEEELMDLQIRYSKLETLLAHEHKLLESVFPRQAIEHMTRVIAARSAARTSAAPPHLPTPVAALEAVSVPNIAGPDSTGAAASSPAAAQAQAHSQPSPRLSAGGALSAFPQGVQPSSPWPQMTPCGMVPQPQPRLSAGMAIRNGGGSLTAQERIPVFHFGSPDRSSGHKTMQLGSRRRIRASMTSSRTSSHGARRDGPPPPQALSPAFLSGSSGSSARSRDGGGPTGGGGGIPSPLRPPPLGTAGLLDVGVPLATAHRCVTVLFADIVGFTSMCNCLQPLEVMGFLNGLYTRFDTLCDIYGVYKVETIGDCFMAVGGLITVDGEGFKAVRGDGSEDTLHALKVMSFAKAMVREVAAMVMPHDGSPMRLRVGLHSGPVTAGIVGAKMPRFCLFGDTVNTASRMESTCEPGAIHVSAATRELLPEEGWAATGGVQVKGKGEMQTFIWRPPPGFAAPKGGFSASVADIGYDERVSGGVVNSASGAGTSWHPGGGGAGARAAVSDGEAVRQQMALLRLATQQGGTRRPGEAAATHVAAGAAGAAVAGGSTNAALTAAVTTGGDARSSSSPRILRPPTQSL